MKGIKRLGPRGTVRPTVGGTDRRVESAGAATAQAASVPPEGDDAPSDSDDCDLTPSPYHPHRVAVRILERSYCNSIGVLTLGRWRGSFFQWSGTSWTEVEDEAIKSTLYRCLKKAEYRDEKGKVKPWAPSKSKIINVVDALGAECFIRGDLDVPCWLRPTAAPPARELIAFSNGLLHVPTRMLYDHDPRLFNRMAVPFAFDPEAPSPSRWLRFLRELWGDDEEAMATLQEWFGYVLSGRTDLQKILLLIGPTRAGKGVIARVLRGLIGAGNVVGPTLSSLNTNFGLQPLLGRSLAIVSDARLGSGPSHVVVERLLSISGEDHLTVDRKYKQPWSGKLSTRFMIASNELPEFVDASGALASRMIVLTLSRSFLGQENPDLTDELTREMPGILNWALVGLDRFNQAGRISIPLSSDDAVLTLQDISSPVAAFVRDHCEKGPEHEVEIPVLYSAWRQWCDEQGCKHGTAQQFGNSIRTVVPSLRVGQARTDAQKRIRVYKGIRQRAHDE